jgi:CDP-diacylglycerol--glycerol-3-phosphate 3-phosphatidyltransferase
MSLADQLTLIRIAAMPIVVGLFVWDFPGHDWGATAVFIAAMTTDWFDERVARWRGHTSPLGSLLDPVADKVLVLTTLIMLVDAGVVPAGLSRRSSPVSSSSPGYGWRRSSAGS